ncbi:MAG: rhodanese-like domain-containing protein [Moraxella sp.]|nr:rhodanese-like domain-containing protein [Moraxella sp.]
MKTLLFVFMLIVVTGCGNQSEATDHAQPITPSAQKSIATGVWIDVRSADEFATGHITGANNLPIATISKDITAIAPNKSTPINLYCRSGRRAKLARTQLMQMGYQHVINHGGFDDIKSLYMTSLDN